MSPKPPGASFVPGPWFWPSDQWASSFRVDLIATRSSSLDEVNLQKSRVDVVPMKHHQNRKRPSTLHTNAKSRSDIVSTETPLWPSASLRRCFATSLTGGRSAKRRSTSAWRCRLVRQGGIYKRVQGCNRDHKAIHFGGSIVVSDSIAAVDLTALGNRKGLGFRLGLSMVEDATTHRLFSHKPGIAVEALPPRSSSARSRSCARKSPNSAAIGPSSSFRW